MNHKSEYQKQISDLADTYIYNHGNSAVIGTSYIINSLQEKLKQKGAK